MGCMAYLDLRTSDNASAVSRLDLKAEGSIIYCKQWLGRMRANTNRGRRDSRVVKLGALGVAS